MNAIRRLCITGITGSVGSWIARQALDNGVELTVLVRPDGLNHVQDRIRRALATAGYKGPTDRIEIVTGDLATTVCRNRLLEACRSVDAVVHCAASMNFEDEYASRNEAVNVQGTQLMLEISEMIGVPFMYLSTAYVAGQTPGLIREVPLKPPPAFNNSYEQTKYKAECEVLEWSHRTGLDVWIFRPSIILGDSRTGRIINFNAMYHILRFLDMVSGKLDGQTLRIGADPNATKNCIPVDYLARSIWYIFRNAEPGIYHITHPEALRLSRLETTLKQLFDINRACFVAPVDLTKTPLSKPEILFRRAASVYFSYFLQEPVFDRSRTDAVLGDKLLCPTLDLVYFNRIINFARESQWGHRHSRSHANPSARSVLTSYYDIFLTGKIGRQLLPDLKRLNAQFKIVVTDVEDSARTITIRDGILTGISNNGQPHECSFSVNFETFRQIAAGVLAPERAFFRKDIEINGNIETGLKLATVLSVFFKKYPFVPDTPDE